MKERLKNSADKLNGLIKLLFFFCYTGVFAYSLLRTIPELSMPLWFLYKFSLYMLIPLSIIAIRKVQRKTLGILAIILVLIVINKIITGSDDFLIMFLLVVSAKGIKFSSIVKYDLFMKIPALIILPIMYFSGLTDVYVHYRNGVIRESMGFFNPNYFSSYLMSAVMEIIYLRRDKIGWKEILLAVVSCFAIAYFADSRTQVISIILLGGGLLVIKNNRVKQIKNSLIKFFIYNSAFILAIGSLGVSLVYSDSSFDYTDINRYTSGRIEMSVDAIRDYGISFIGNKRSAITNLVDESITLDNVYIYIFSVHGVLSLLLYCVFIRKYFKYADSKQEIMIILIMFCFMVSGLATRACMRPRFNVFLLYFAYLLYGNPEEKSAEEIEGKING